MACLLRPFWYVVVSLDTFLLTDAGEVNGICLLILFHCCCWVIMSSRRPPPSRLKGFSFSPEKDECSYCGRVVVAGPMGLVRHLARHPDCQLEYSMEHNSSFQVSSQSFAHDTVIVGEADDIRTHCTNGPSSLVNPSVSSVSYDSVRRLSYDVIAGNEPVDDDFPVAHDESYDEEVILEGSEGVGGQSCLSPNAESTPMVLLDDACVDTSILDTYVARSESLNDGLSLSLFSIEEKVQVDLLQTLKKLRAPMVAYDEIMRWAIRSSLQGHVFRDIPLSSRKTVVKKLKVRVDVDSLCPIVKEIYLPYSKRFVEVVFFSAHAIFGSFLSCPDLNQDQNYIFNDEHDPNCNPFARPNGAIISDINTGRCYLRTYDQLVKNPEDMLLACILAIDKTTCDVGGGGRLSLEPIVVSYGLMKHDVRKTPLAMRVLGFINTSPIHHRNSAPNNRDVPVGTEPLPSNHQTSEVTAAAWRLNEYHMQIDFILRESGYLDLQRTGLKWNLRFRGKAYPVVLHPFIPFIIGDTEGHDSLCGHFKSRTENVAQLCRACECPTMLSGYSKSRQFAQRKPRIINKLVRDQDFVALKAMSQQYLKNAFDNVRFGLHNDRGIFGACPGEILHLVLIGWFRNVVDSFFIQIGKDSVKAHLYDTLLHDINHCLGRQSDRDVPSTSTQKGFSSTANIPGHEYAGCLFVMLISFYSSRFREIFHTARASKKQDARDKALSNVGFLEDWKSTVSALLEWHMWLKQQEIRRTSVSKSVYATSWLMRRLKFVAPRLTGGMLNNTIKTHLVLHIHEDVLNFGVPEVMNSSYSESGHITICKDTTRNTQKRSRTFTFQAAMRYVENLAIARGFSAMHDSSGGTNFPTVTVPAAKLSGKSFIISTDANGNPRSLRLRSSKKARDSPSDDFPLDAHVLETVAKYCLPCVNPKVVNCYTEYHPKSGGQLYRAHPSYHGEGKPWFDHVFVQWRVDTGKIVFHPGRVHVFIDFRNIIPRSTITFPESGQEVSPKPGFYAVIESYDEVEQPFLQAKDDSPQEMEPEFDFSLFQKFRLTLLPNSTKPKLFLVHTDSIVGPTVSIPDAFGDTPLQVSGPSIPDVDYIFLSRRKQEWAQIWEAFILEHDVRVNGAEGYESDDDDYSEEGDVPVFRGAGTAASATGDDDFVLHGKQKRSNTKGDRRKPKKQRGTSTKKKKRVIIK